MKVNPKLTKLTEEELKAWELKVKKMEFESHNKDMYNKINTGRGWLF